MLDLGIKKELVAKAGIPIDVPLKLEKPNAFFKTHLFPVVLLTLVEFVPDQLTVDSQTKEETRQPVLKFHFKDSVNTEKKMTDIRYPLDPEDEKFPMKLEALQKSIKHIFETTIGEDKFDEADFGGTTFAELFQNSANAFNKHVYVKTAATEDTAEVTAPKYATVSMYLKAVYYKERVQLPMYPNFVQKATKRVENKVVQVPCELSISSKDTIVKLSSATPANGIGNARDNSFGGTAFQGGTFGMDAGPAQDMVFPD